MLYSTQKLKILLKFIILKVQKMKKILATCLFLGLIFSCSEKNEQTTETKNTSSEVTNSIETNANETSNTANQTSEITEEIALNPEHGLPGHRCDLPVGAPLDGSVSPQNSQPQMQTSPSQANPFTSGGASSGQGRINPEHGMPGHLCEYPVGAVIPG